MAISVDWSVTPWMITIPQSDLTLESGTKYKLTVDTFWQLLRDFTDSPEAIPRPRLYSRTAATASTPSITEVDEIYYALQFEDGVYSVNITDGNTNIRNVEVKNSVSVNTNNTTGFIDPVFLEYSVFDGGVTIDTANGVAGTGKTPEGFRIGTGKAPVNNLADADTISNGEGFSTFYINASMTLTGAFDFSAGYKFVGFSPVTVMLNIDTSIDVSNCEFSNVQITGVLDGNSVFRECIVTTVNYVNGFIYNSTLTGTITLGGGVSASLQGCWQQSGGSIPVIDMGGAGQQLSLSNYNGEVLIANCTGAGNNYISGDGRVTLDATVTAGTFVVYGDMEIDNNSSATVINNTSHSLVWEHVLEDQGSLTAKQLMQVSSAALAGRVEVSLDGLTVTFRTPNNGAIRITSTVDANGQRTNQVFNFA